MHVRRSRFKQRDCKTTNFQALIFVYEGKIILVSNALQAMTFILFTIIA